VCDCGHIRPLRSGMSRSRGMSAAAPPGLRPLTAVHNSYPAPGTGPPKTPLTRHYLGPRPPLAALASTHNIVLRSGWYRENR
jgi:hypothetical protein